MRSLKFSFSSDLQHFLRLSGNFAVTLFPAYEIRRLLRISQRTDSMDPFGYIITPICTEIKDRDQQSEPKWRRIFNFVDWKVSYQHRYGEYCK